MCSGTKYFLRSSLGTISVYIGDISAKFGSRSEHIMVIVLVDFGRAHDKEGSDV